MAGGTVEGITFVLERGCLFCFEQFWPGDFTHGQIAVAHGETNCYV